MLNAITFIQKNGFDEDGKESIIYETSIPLEILDALRQHRHLPQTPYLHWRRITRLYYAVTLGDKCEKCEDILLNHTVLPRHVIQEIKTEEELSSLEANAIIWSIKRWHGRPVATARIFLGYGKNIPVETSYKSVALPPEIRYYMQLKTRTILYWKQIGEDSWIITKSTKNYDAKSWITCDTLTIPKKFLTFNYSMFVEMTVQLTEKDGKPALVLTRTVFRTSFEEFLDDTIKKGNGKIEIHDLYNLYLEYIKKNKPEEYPLSFKGFLDRLSPRILPLESYATILSHPEETYYIRGFSLKTQTNERGDNNGR